MWRNSRIDDADSIRAINNDPWRFNRAIALHGPPSGLHAQAAGLKDNGPYARARFPRVLQRVVKPFRLQYHEGPHCNTDCSTNRAF